MELIRLPPVRNHHPVDSPTSVPRAMRMMHEDRTHDLHQIPSAFVEDLELDHPVKSMYCGL